MKALPEFASLFGEGLSQHARLITLASAQQGGLPESLVVERFRGREAVNALFWFDVDALSVSTDLDLSTFKGNTRLLRKRRLRQSSRFQVRRRKVVLG